MVHHVGAQVLFIIFPFSITHFGLFSDFAGPLTFLPDSFISWLDFAKSAVSASLVIFSRDYKGFSVAHADYQTIISLVNYQFLPLNELESAFSVNGYLTFTEPATMEKP